jgi:hypothetical protein
MKHIPQSPLPWVADLRGAPKSQPRLSVKVKDMHGAESLHAIGLVCGVNDAAYAAHAANAYPRLVAELKHALYLERSKKYAATLRALLVDLGESE